MHAAELLNGVNDLSLFRTPINMRHKDWVKDIVRRVVRNCDIKVNKGKILSHSSNTSMNGYEEHNKYIVPNARYLFLKIHIPEVLKIRLQLFLTSSMTPFPSANLNVYLIYLTM